MKKKLSTKKIKGTLDVWSLFKQMNTDHEDFGKVAKFLGKHEWEVEISINKTI